MDDGETGAACSAYHSSRFAGDRWRRVLWQTFWDAHFGRLIRPEHWVLDLGSGYGSCMNVAVARRRVAEDTFPDLPRYAAPGVGSVTDLGFDEDGAVDFAFASNLFEHSHQPAFAAVFRRVPRQARVMAC